MLKKLKAATLSDLIQSSPAGLLLLDENKTVCWINDTLSKMLGSRAALLQDKTAEQVEAPYKALFESEGIVQLPATDTDDELWLMCTSQQTESSGQAQFFIDVTALQQLQSELKDIRAIDDETGLPNNKALLQRLEPQVSRSRRYNNPLSIIVMRITNLESLQNKYTDDYAHILLAISQMLNDQMRWADIIGRLSHTDFLLVLPETHSDAASGIVEKIHERMKMIDVPEIDIAAKDINVSFGVAEWQKGDDVSLLMTRAHGMLDKPSSDAA